MKVLIAGGGIAGLTLAQGLHREGVECQVFERDPLESWRTGYLLNLDVEGDHGLEACLPPDLYELFKRASGQTMSGHDESVVLNPMGEKLTSMPHFGESAIGDRPPTNIDRRTLRQILLAGLDEVVHHGCEAADVEVNDGSVTLVLADGTHVVGDMLVAADGVGSAVRRRVMPGVEIIPSPVGALGLFGRAPLTDAVAAQVPQDIWDAGFAIVSDGRGTMLGIGHWDPRQPVNEAAAELGVDGTFDQASPYFMLNGAIPPSIEVPPPAEWIADTPRLMHETMIATVSGWHPVVRGLVEAIDPTTLFSHPFRRLDPTPPWTTSRVTFLGDAINAMLPTLGKGANMAMRNASVLRDQLVAADRGELPLLGAIAAYEEDMRSATYPLMEIAADHGRFGGGGLRGPADGQPEGVRA